MKPGITTFASILFSFLFVLLFAGAGKIQKNQMPAYKNTSLPIGDRIQDLISRITLKEKIDLLGGTGFATKPIKRLGIPELKMTDGPLGVRWHKSSAFAGGIGAAATWDTAAVNQLGSAIGREVRAKGRDVILGPEVNIARLPMGGRNFECFGEDPYLESRLAVNYIKGVQKEDVAATVKHFAANNQEYERMFVNAEVSRRALNEIYLQAFKAAVTEGHVLCIMAAYNRLNGTFCAENNYLLKKKLKDEWGFKGLAMSDWGAVHSSIPTAKSALDLEMPTGEYLNDSTLYNAVKSGEVSEQTINDKVKRILYVIFKLGLYDHPRKAEPQLLNSKQNQEVALKVAREGIVLLKNEDGILPLNKSKIKSIAVIGPNAAFARTGGGGSANVTPIFSVDPLTALKDKLGSSVKINYAPGVVFEGDAMPVESKYLFTPDGKANGLLGEYFPDENLKGKPSFTRTDKQINFMWGTGSPKKGFPEDHFSVRWTGYIKVPQSGDYVLNIVSDDGCRLFIDNDEVVNDWTNHSAEGHPYKMNLQADKKYKIKIEYYDNVGDATCIFSWNKTGEDLMKNAVQAAANSDVAVIFAGTSAEFETEGKDRENLILPDNQDELINEVAKVNKNVIVVLTTGSPVLMEKWQSKVKGIMETWFAGEEIGNAAADVLLGNFNPSGKLPITFPKRWQDCSAYKTYKVQDSVSDYSDGIFVGYRWFDKNNIEPQYPFGFGLSYTTFEFDNLKVNESNLNGETIYKVSFNIKNTGKIAGAEVAQLYVGAIDSKVERAPIELKSFTRIQLKPGESRIVEMSIRKDTFAYYNADNNKWTVDPGKYEIMIGNSSRDIRLKDIITLR